MEPLLRAGPRLAELEKRELLSRFRYPLELSRYEELCRLLRGKVVELSGRARTPHLASQLSCIEIVAALYGSILKIGPKSAHAPDRDRFVFSKGHAATTLYSALAFFEFFPLQRLEEFATAGSVLAEQPIPGCLPGVEAATGSLGHGLPIGVGMAMAAKIQGRNYRTFVLISDGECNEGTVWEAAMLASAKGLDNLVAIVDFNKWQATGRSEEVMQLSPLKDKFAAFGWSAFEVDGHSVEEIVSVLQQIPCQAGHPLAVIAHTVKGKGVSFMEDDNNWHYRIPTQEEVEKAKTELGLL